MEKMPKGVLSQLSELETLARKRNNKASQPNRLEELKATVEALVIQRDQLKAEIEANESLQKLRAKDTSHNLEGEEMSDGSVNSQLLQLMARHTQLKDLLRAHHLIGGYDIIKTRHGNGVCISVCTAYEGVYLDTYNLDMDLAATLRISRHNIPPFIPLERLAEQGNMQTDLRAFLDNLGQHLNAFTGRKQQLKLVKERHASVTVMESNAPCSLLVLMFTVPVENTAALCTLEYSDHARCLPTKVLIQSEDKDLTESPRWKKNCTLLMETPVHKALAAMIQNGDVK